MIHAVIQAMGQQEEQQVTKKVASAARNLLLQGKVPVEGAAAANQWLHKEHATEDLRRYYSDFVTYGTGRRADVFHESHPHESSVSEEELQECIQAISDAVASGAWLHNREVVSSTVPEVQQVLEQHGITTNHLFRLMQSYDKRLKVLVVAETKRPFTEQEKAERLQYIAQMQQLTEAELHRFIWIDQKIVYIKPEGNIKSWGVKGETNKSALATTPLLDASHKGWRIYYYIAVSPILGPVLMKRMTGCTGRGIGPSEYIVSDQVSIELCWGACCSGGCRSHSTLLLHHVPDAKPIPHTWPTRYSHPCSVPSTAPSPALCPCC
jgi:hypothetical protein